MRCLTSLFLAISLLFTTGCSPISSTGGATSSEIYEITDATMVTLSSVEAKSPRVVAVGNGSAEILLALGLKSLIVGRDIASEIVGLVDIPIVTNGHDLSSEKVILKNPDLLIVDSNTSPQRAISQIKNTGVRVIEIPERFDIEGIYAKINSIAEAVGQSARGRDLNQKIRNSLKATSAMKNPQVLFLYLRGSNGIFLVGGNGSGADAVIGAAGGVDLGSTLYKNPFTPINSEAILGLDPDIYLVMSKGLDSVGGLDAFRKLPGIDKSKPVIAVDDSLLLSFGPRTSDLVSQLAGLFKELFKASM